MQTLWFIAIAIVPQSVQIVGDSIPSTLLMFGWGHEDGDDGSGATSVVTTLDDRGLMKQYLNSFFVKADKIFFWTSKKLLKNIQLSRKPPQLTVND